MAGYVSFSHWLLAVLDDASPRQRFRTGDGSAMHFLVTLP